MNQFDFHPRTQIVFGEGSFARTAELILGIDSQFQKSCRALLVTDPGIAAAGYSAQLAASLVEAGMYVSIFDQVRENPTTRDVEACLQIAKTFEPNLIIGLGGGSSMDTAKGCNFLLTNGGRMQDYQGIGKATKPMLPLIAIPTTAGTGSECQSFALIADERTHQKMACGDPKAAARIAILDPLLTLTQPARVAACTGIDAVAHAVETAVTKTRNPVSLLFSHAAFRLLSKNFSRLFSEPSNLEARAAMQLGAAYGGMAIENSMLGAAHSAANPLTAHFGMVHGQAVGLMLPHVMRFNAEDCDARVSYSDLAIAAQLVESHAPTAQCVEALIARIEEMLAVASLPNRLSNLKVTTSQIPMLAEEAARQWTARFNPREITAKDFERMYESAL